VHLVQTGGGDDEKLRESWNQIGEYYEDRFKWKKSAQFYAQANNVEKMIESFYFLNQFDALRRIKDTISGHSNHLLRLARMFESVGLDEDAISCYERFGDPRAGLDCAIRLKSWSEAVRLAKLHDFPQVESLIARQATELMERGFRFQAVELYRKSNKPVDAALLLADVAEEVGVKHGNPVQAKKLYVLAALEVERHRQQVMDETSQASSTSVTQLGSTRRNLTLSQGSTSIANKTAATLDTLMTSFDVESSNNKKALKVLDNAWKGAAAYHYFGLSLSQLYRGNINDAMKTAIRLCEFEDVLDAKIIYSLIALTSFHTEFYGVCSKAFVKLETMPQLSEEERERFQSLSVSIFTSFQPEDPAQLEPEYMACLEHGESYDACTLSGRSIQNSPVTACGRCKFKALNHHLKHDHVCPLCHGHLA
jgi:WD repeat-containing protein 35